MMFQIGHCLQLISSARQASWILQGGITIFQPYHDSHIHFCIGKLLHVNKWSCGRACWEFAFPYFWSKLGRFPTVILCHFRTRSELDRYLEASQIRERAIERINDVTGTYGFFSLLQNIMGFCFVNVAYSCIHD